MLLMRRAPKLTVTREGDSLRQNGCYPMAALSCWFSVSLCLVILCGFDSEIKRAGGRLASSSSRPPAVERVEAKGGDELFTIFKGAPGVWRR